MSAALTATGAMNPNAGMIGVTPSARPNGSMQACPHCRKPLSGISGTPAPNTTAAIVDEKISATDLVMLLFSLTPHSNRSLRGQHYFQRFHQLTPGLSKETKTKVLQLIMQIKPEFFADLQIEGDPTASDLLRKLGEDHKEGESPSAATAAAAARTPAMSHDERNKMRRQQMWDSSAAPNQTRFDNKRATILQSWHNPYRDFLREGRVRSVKETNTDKALENALDRAMAHYKNKLTPKEFFSIFIHMAHNIALMDTVAGSDGIELYFGIYEHTKGHTLSPAFRMGLVEAFLEYNRTKVRPPLPAGLTINNKWGKEIDERGTSTEPPFTISH